MTPTCGPGSPPAPGRVAGIALPALLALALLAAGVAPLRAAVYQGRIVDGHRYHASIVNYDYGAYDNVEVQFHGDRAFVYFPEGGRLVLILEEEEIQDPHHIRTEDPRRGIAWEIDVKDLAS